MGEFGSWLMLNDDSSARKTEELCNDCTPHIVRVTNDNQDSSQLIHVGAHIWQDRTYSWYNTDCNGATDWTSPKNFSIKCLSSGDKSNFNLEYGSGWLNPIEFGPGETKEFEVLLDWTRQGVVKDWSVTAWGEGGEVTVAHQDGTPSASLTGNDPIDEGEADDGGADDGDADDGGDDGEADDGEADDGEADDGEEGDDEWDGQCDAELDCTDANNNFRWECCADDGEEGDDEWDGQCGTEFDCTDTNNNFRWECCADNDDGEWDDGEDGGDGDGEWDDGEEQEWDGQCDADNDCYGEDGSFQYECCFEYGDYGDYCENVEEQTCDTDPEWQCFTTDGCFKEDCCGDDYGDYGDDDEYGDYGDDNEYGDYGDDGEYGDDE